MLDEAHEFLRLAQLQVDRLRSHSDAQQGERARTARLGHDALRDARKLTHLTDDEKRRADEIEAALRAEVPNAR